MLKVGFIGPPSSGKAKTIQLVANESERCWQSVNPGTSLEQEYEQAMGHWAAWSHNLWAFYRAFENERSEDNTNLIMLCNGTILGPLAHATATLETRQLLKAQTDQTEREILKLQQAILVLSMLFFENWNYDLVFYCDPLDTTLRMDGDELVFAYNQRVDNASRAIVELADMWPRVTRLSGPISERVPVVIDRIKRTLDKVDVRSEPAASNKEQ